MVLAIVLTECIYIRSSYAQVYTHKSFKDILKNAGLFIDI